MPSPHPLEAPVDGAITPPSCERWPKQYGQKSVVWESNPQDVEPALTSYSRGRDLLLGASSFDELQRVFFEISEKLRVKSTD